MREHNISANIYLHKDTKAYFNCQFTGYRTEGNPDYLNTIKNQFGSTPKTELTNAYERVKEVFTADLSALIEMFSDEELVIICVPRSKCNFKANQLYFSKAISCVVDDFDSEEIINGCSVIKRIKNTKTTHIRQELEYFNNDGNEPYPGITKDTCQFNIEMIEDKKIILVDDIYTRSVNVDEDCIQALYDLGAREIILYTIGKTK